MREPYWRAPGSDPVVAPSILSADFTRLGDEIARVRVPGMGALHLDVMDGHFVPNITFGPPLVRSVRSVTDGFLECHLMIEEPLRYAGAFADAGADLIAIHAELFQDCVPALEEIRALGVRSGIVVNPDTPLERIGVGLAHCDLLLIMSVFPGFGGQAFRPEAVDKVEEANGIRKRHGHRFAIEVDGGVSAGNAGVLARAGADVLVAGSAVFGADDPAGAVREIAGAGREALRG